MSSNVAREAFGFVALAPLLIKEFRVMKTIFKYPLHANPSYLTLSRDCKILSVQVQDKVPTVWEEYDPSQEPQEVTFVIAPTGGFVPENAEYVGTFQDDWFVGHVYAQRAS